MKVAAAHRPITVALTSIAAMLAGAHAVSANEPVGQTPPSENYILHCSGCHRLDGHGVPGSTPSLHGLAFLLASPAGRAYLLRVPGVAQAPLGDAELATLMNWVLAEWSGSAPRPAFSATEVGRLRLQPLRDARAARAVLAPVSSEKVGLSDRQ